LETQTEVTFPKEMLVFIPLVGTVIAISFDVGYFSGIDINFFTLFSLTEHVVFALEASPFALAAAVAVTLAVKLRVGETLIEKLSKSKSDEKLIEKLSKSKSRSKIEIVVLVTLMVAGLAIIALSFYLTHFFWMVFVALLAGGVVSWVKHRTLPKATLYSIVGVLVITAAFVWGYDIAADYTTNNKVVHHSIQFENETHEVNLIRSGDRGVLYYEPTSAQVVFVRWETVKKLTRIR